MFFKKKWRVFIAGSLIAKRLVLPRGGRGLLSGMYNLEFESITLIRGTLFTLIHLFQEIDQWLKEKYWLWMMNLTFAM